MLSLPSVHGIIEPEIENGQQGIAQSQPESPPFPILGQTLPHLPDIAVVDERDHLETEQEFPTSVRIDESGRKGVRADLERGEEIGGLDPDFLADFGGVVLLRTDLAPAVAAHAARPAQEEAFRIEI